MASTSPIVPELPIIRTRQEGEQRATFFELFFDLVYVFAVTQLSHYLLDDISWATAAVTAFMLVALYWAWNYTTWMTNWFDSDTVPVRLVLVFVMLASLLMAIAIPEDSASTHLLFACAYSACRSGCAPGTPDGRDLGQRPRAAGSVVGRPWQHLGARPHAHLVPGAAVAILGAKQRL